MYKVKYLLDACFTAKRITETMLELPKGLKPRHIYVIDCITKTRIIKENVCVSDISSTLKITTPSVTKLINELDEKGLINKENRDEDKRVVTLSLTDLGEEYYNYFVVEYHNRMDYKLKDISSEQCEIAIDIIEKMYKAVKNIEKEGLENE